MPILQAMNSQKSYILRQWVVSLPTATGFTTWLGMCGSGAGIGQEVVPQRYRRIPVGQQRVWRGRSAADLLVVVQVAAGSRVTPEPNRLSPATRSGFVLPVPQSHNFRFHVFCAESRWNEIPLRLDHLSAMACPPQTSSGRADIFSVTEDFPSFSRPQPLSVRLENGLLQHSERVRAPQSHRKKPRPRWRWILQDWDRRLGNAKRSPNSKLSHKSLGQS